MVFDWLGTGSPGAQAFEFYDASFNTVEQGVTTPIPEPSTALLMTLGLLRLATHARGTHRKPPPS